MLYEVITGSAMTHHPHVHGIVPGGGDGRDQTGDAVQPGVSGGDGTGDRIDVGGEDRHPPQPGVV